MLTAKTIQNLLYAKYFDIYWNFKKELNYHLTFISMKNNSNNSYVVSLVSRIYNKHA